MQMDLSDRHESESKGTQAKLRGDTKTKGKGNSKMLPPILRGSIEQWQSFSEAEKSKDQLNDSGGSVGRSVDLL